MIRTLLVDDDYIVRKGLLHILPWARFGMQVVADFESGEDALDWMKQHSVDLLVTDLTMPGMSGFEFIEKARAVRPGAKAVILTCHQDFQYVQDALRMGAIDYIVKTELDDSKLDKLFESIVHKLQDQETVLHDVSNAVLIWSEDDGDPAELYSLPWVQEHKLNPLRKKAWYAYVRGQVGPWRERVEGGKRWRVAVIHHAPAECGKRQEPLLLDMMDRHAYYSTEDASGTVHVQFDELMRWQEVKPKREWTEMFRQFGWLFQEAPFDQMIAVIESSRPRPEEVNSLFDGTAAGWRAMHRLAAVGEKYAAPGVKPNSWSERKAWLCKLRAEVQAYVAEARLDEEIMARMLCAADWAKHHLEDGANQEDAAAVVHLSRGYFSECFKRCADMTYHEYTRNLRMDLAKSLLVHGDALIWEVAGRCGIADEAYFRKLFHRETGLTPKEYRDRYAQERTH